MYINIYIYISNNKVRTGNLASGYWESSVQVSDVRVCEGMGGCQNQLFTPGADM